MAVRRLCAGVAPTAANRLAYRDLLVTAPGLSDGVTGVILGEITGVVRGDVPSNIRQ